MTTTTPKKTAKPTGPKSAGPPPAFNAGSGTASKGWNLGAYLKSVGLPTSYKGVDYTKKSLQYVAETKIGKTFDFTPTSDTEFQAAIQQLRTIYPALWISLQNKFQTPANATYKQKEAGWQAVVDSSFNLVKAQSAEQIGIKATGKAVKAELTFLSGQLANGRTDTILGALTSATASEKANAINNIDNTIQSWNYTPKQLDFLSGVVANLATRSGAFLTNQNALLDVLRGEANPGLPKAEFDKIKTDYQEAFPGLTAYNQQKGAIHMTESNYNAYTGKIQDIATQYGAPMPTQGQVGALLNGHVSPTEYQQRVTDIYAAVSSADPNVKRQLEKQYGVSQSGLMHYFMDPKNALQNMQRQVAGAEIQDYAGRVGLKGLDPNQFKNLADMAKVSAAAGNNPLGYGVSNIEGSLLSASKDNALLASNPGAAKAPLSTQQLVGSQLAGFGGSSQIADQSAVERAEQTRAAPFEKGGGYQDTAKGVVGLGGAKT